MPLNTLHRTVPCLWCVFVEKLECVHTSVYMYLWVCSFYTMTDVCDLKHSW